MKKTLSLIIAGVLSCTSLYACGTHEHTEEEKDVDKYAGSKYALTVEEYEHITKFEENEVYLFTGEIYFEEYQIMDGLDCPFNYFHFDGCTHHEHGTDLGIVLSDIELETAENIGFNDGADVYLLYKNEASTDNKVESWNFYNKPAVEKICSFMKDFGSENLKAENFVFDSQIGDYVFSSDTGYIFLSPEEADAAYEKMLSEGGINTVQHRDSVENEE